MRTLPRISRREVSMWIVAMVAVAGCNSVTQPPVPDRMQRSTDPATLGDGCDRTPDSHCSNPINRIVIQMLRGANLPIADDSKSEICRRMALDLVGRIPTTVERSGICETATVEDMATYFMGLPAYLRQQGRVWGDHFYNLDEQWYLYVAEIDAMVTALFAEGIRYETFMTQLVVHPGFYQRFQGDDWAANVARFALGRPARADEVAGMRPLQQAWDSRYFCDGVIWDNALVDNNGLRMGADGSCGRTEFAINFCRCRTDSGAPRCQTSVFGAPVDFGVDGCVNPEHPDDDHNMLRVTAAAAGRVAICPTGGNLPECADRPFGDHGPEGQLSRLGSLTTAQTDRLYGLGRALAARPDFWEAAVDRELRHFLTWWQNGLRRPDFDIPAVRSVLADRLKRSGSIKQLQFDIVTSLLFTQPSELPPGTVTPPPDAPQPPIWSMGPSRVLNAERWLDSVSYVTFGQTLGVCDYRFVASNYNWSRMTHRGLIWQPDTLPPDMTYAEHYHDWAEALGGCSAVLSRTTSSSLSVASTQNFLAQKLCANGTTVLPANYSETDRSPANLEAGITNLYQRALNRSPSADERTTARGEIEACLAAGPDMGCSDAGTGIRWFCERLLDSAEFAIF